MRQRLERALAGRYDLVRMVGEGATSEVWLAMDLRHRRPVALKALRPDVSDQLGARRFLREIEFVARLNHPHILPLHDSGDADGLLFFTAPYVASGSLRGRMGLERCLPLSDALRIAREVADALDYAHRAEVIHRDLKPENILLQEGHAVVGDFGLARAIGKAATSSHTSSGVLLGTPAYMSPEQAAGRADLDGRTDLYSLGCILYEMLAGSRPFHGETVAQLVLQHLSAPPPDLGEVRPDLPDRVRLAVWRSLAKERDERFATGAAMMQALVGEGSELESPPRRAAATRGLSDPQRDSLRSFPDFATRFVGRVEAFEEAARRLRSHRLVSLVGFAGVGKTRLAVEVARARIHDYADGAWFVDLAPLLEGARVSQAIAATLGLTPVAGTPLEDQLRALLEKREALLVLDNCEQVRSACAACARELLQHCRGLAILATSREALGLAIESAYPLAPLTRPSSAELGHELMRYEAVELFVDRAVQADPSFRLTADNASAVAAICRHADGVPLALELIAGRLQMLDIEEIRARLGKILRLGATREDRLPARQRLLSATLEWSHSLLNDDERELFMRLAVFAAGWTLEAATAVSGWDELKVLDVLTALSAKSLVMRDREVAGRSRHRYLEIVRQFALERLGQTGREHEVRGALLDYLVRFSSEAETGLWGAESERWLQWLEADHETLLSALRWGSEDRVFLERSLWVAGALYRFWYTRGYFAIAREALARLLASPGAEACSDARLSALYGAAGMALYAGDYEASRRMYEEGLARCREAGDARRIARWSVGLGLALGNLGDLEGAQRCCEEAVEIYRRMDEPRGSAVALLNLAGIVCRRGDQERGLACASEALEQARRNDNRVMSATILTTLATLQFESGHWPEARASLTVCLKAVLDLDLRKTGLDALELMANLAVGQGDPARALEVLGAVDGLRQSWGVLREPPDRDAFQARLDRLREILGEQRFDASYAEGLGLGFQPALDRALQWLDSKEA